MSEMSELQQAVAEHKRLVAAGRRQTLARALAKAGRKAGARNPQQLHRMVEPDDVEWDDTGEVANAPALVAALVESDGYLFEAPASVARDRDTHGRFASTRSRPEASSPKGWPINELLRSAAGTTVDREADSAEEINSMLRAATGRAQPGRRT